jgi:hypothetical protein
MVIALPKGYPRVLLSRRVVVPVSDQDEALEFWEPR